MGFKVPSGFFDGIFSVDTSPFDSNTTKRPLAVMSPANELNEAVGDDVSWMTNGSGVALGVWVRTEENAPETSVSTTMAHKEQKACFTKPSEIKTQIRAD